MPTQPRAIHIVSGQSAAALLRQALRVDQEELLISDDPLSYGPAPATTDLQEWKSVRERYLLGLTRSPETAAEDQHSLGGLDAERLREGLPLVVWCGEVLSEQLLLARVATLLDWLGVGATGLQIVDATLPEKADRPLAVAVLTPEQILRLPEARCLLPEELDELKRAWGAYTSDDPSDLASFVGEAGRLPKLRRAMSRLVYRYPDAGSGLSVWDERLLYYTREQGPRATRVLGFAMGYNDTPDWVGDAYLFRRLMDMAAPNLASPLISVVGSRDQLRECRVALTDFGEKVLTSRRNQVRTNGIDDWIGGVHLTSDGHVTFRRGDTLLLDS